MFLKVLIFTFLTFLILNFNSTVRGKPNKDDYEKYLISVLQHIESQREGWLSMKHLYLKLGHDQRLNALDYQFPGTTEDNYIIKLQMLTRYINCRYTELLNTFTNLLETFLENCGIYLTNEMTLEYNSCASQLSTTVVQSAHFFEKLSAAITFIGELDLRIIHPNIIKPDTIVDEVNTYFRFFKWKKTQVSFANLDVYAYEEKVSKEYKDLTKFLINTARPNVIKLLEKALDNCDFDTNDDFSSGNRMVYNQSVGNISNRLVTFLKRIVENEYDKMGFDCLIKPNENNCRYLMPPVNRHKTKHGIDFLTELFTYTGWKQLTYQGLISRDNYGDVHYLDTPVDDNNYINIQSYTIRLIKYIYAERILYFYCILTLLLNNCCGETTFEGRFPIINSNTINIFTECARDVHDTMNMSVVMLKSMLIALKKLKMSVKNFNKDRHFVWTIEEIIMSIISFIENVELNNYAASDFNTVVASQYFESLNIFLTNDVLKKLRKAVSVSNRYCHSNIFINVDTYLKEKVLRTVRVTPKDPYASFKMLCEVLKKFYGDVVEEEFKQLGFHQAII